jgi:hypothetical protein
MRPCMEGFFYALDDIHFINIVITLATFLQSVSCVNVMDNAQAKFIQGICLIITEPEDAFRP